MREFGRFEVSVAQPIGNKLTEPGCADGKNQKVFGNRVAYATSGCESDLLLKKEQQQ
jgi:hypothetical protein